MARPDVWIGNRLNTGGTVENRPERQRRRGIPCFAMAPPMLNSAPMLFAASNTTPFEADSRSLRARGEGVK